VIYILLGLLIALAWAIWFILQWTIWIPLIATGALGFVMLIVFAIKKFRERRSAKALEKALSDQGKQQVMNARPEKRAEIEALQKQITEGIGALKTSKVGGKQRGFSAIYSLPWYAIIGPPGAGKTTALRHSGLVFPYADQAVKGVGGTRNCDWWFTNEAIILDTAGRYATESDDQQEWLAFLDMLRKHRTSKPLNGLIIAVSITDVVDATEVQLEAMGKKLRARIDEVMTRLRMTLPVYFLITKCDLVAGFIEFFGSLRKSERAQAWGATIPLNEDKSDPGAIFGREFDAIVQEVHARAVKRMAQERNRQARESIFQFPIELAGIKRNVQDLISQVFAPNAFQGTPTFRGFYFSSGTQEGTPMNRVLQRMGAAMGIQPQQLQQVPQVESKSYFLHDVFMKVVFPDANVAARSAAEVRRQRLVRLAVAATALVVAAAFAGPSIYSYMNNTALLDSTESRAKKAASIDWESADPISQKLAKLDPLLERLKLLDKYEADGVPASHKFLMYSGDSIHGPLIRVYVANMQQGFVRPVKVRLERKLLEATGDRYFEERLTLKTYLMLSDVAHLDVDWATGRYTMLWADEAKATSDIKVSALKKRMRPHIQYYLNLIKPDSGLLGVGGSDKPRATPVPANDKVVEKARAVLEDVPVRKRYMSLFIDSLNYELYDPAEDRVRSNMQFPPITLDAMFTDRPEVLEWLQSEQNNKTKRYYEVPGPYTDKGHYAVLANIKDAKALLESEQWVVPLTKEERPTRIPANIKRLAEDYETAYINHWENFFKDLHVKSPTTLKEAIDLYAKLQKQERPYMRLLRALEDHTQWKKDLDSVTQNKALNRVANRKLNTALSRRMRGLRFNIKVERIAGRASRVPPKFKETVEFGVPKTAKGNLNETSLHQYMELLGGLRAQMVEQLDKDAEAKMNTVILDVQKAVEESEALLAPYDNTAKLLLLPLLQLPLAVNDQVKLSNALTLKAPPSNNPDKP
jgi:type VI secretion system protein ImpL